MLEEWSEIPVQNWNAYTSFDPDNIHAEGYRQTALSGFNRESRYSKDWAHQVSLDDKEIDKERGVIVEECEIKGSGRGADAAKKYILCFRKGSRYADRTDRTE